MLNNPIVRRAVPAMIHWVVGYVLDQDVESPDGEILEETNLADADSDERTVSILVTERTAVIVAENSDQA